MCSRLVCTKALKGQEALKSCCMKLLKFSLDFTREPKILEDPETYLPRKAGYKARNHPRRTECILGRNAYGRVIQAL